MKSSKYAYRVLPREHSTQPNSGPKVNVGVRNSSGFRPSRRKDCFNAVKRNSFSGIDGEGGRMVNIFDAEIDWGEERKRGRCCVCLFWKSFVALDFGAGGHYKFYSSYGSPHYT